MAEVKINIPNVYLSDIEDILHKVKSVTGKEDTEISFEFLIATFFPTSWKNIQDELNRQYTKGYIQGRIDKEKEYARTQEDDADCFCD